MLRCHLFQVERTTLLNDIEEADERIITDNTSILDQILLYGNDFIVIIPIDFVSSEYRLYFAHDVIIEKKTRLCDKITEIFAFFILLVLIACV